MLLRYEGQRRFKNILGATAKKVWMDGWYTVSHPYATYRKNKLIYTELPQHVLAFSAGRHGKVLKLKKKKSEVILWFQGMFAVALALR